MALFTFTKKILAGEPIDVFNFGKHTRDFTYVDDIVEGIVRTTRPRSRTKPRVGQQRSRPGNLGRAVPHLQYRQQQPGRPDDYIEVLEQNLGRVAQKNLLPLQPGDVPDTFANVDDLIADVDYKPSTSIELGIERFVDWYLDYYDIPTSTTTADQKTNEGADHRRRRLHRQPYGDRAHRRRPRRRPFRQPVQQLHGRGGRRPDPGQPPDHVRSGRHLGQRRSRSGCSNRTSSMRSCILRPSKQSENPSAIR